MEVDLFRRIGDLVQVKFGQGWLMYHQFAVMRFAGRSKDEIVRSGDFLNYDITWDDTERVFSELSKVIDVRNRFSAVFNRYSEMIKSLSRLNETLTQK